MFITKRASFLDQRLKSNGLSYVYFLDFLGVNLVSVDLVQGTAKPLNEGKKVLSTLEDLDPNCSNEIGLHIEFRESVCSEPGRLQIHSEHTFSLDISNNLSSLETRTKEPTSILGFLMRMGMGQ